MLQNFCFQSVLPHPKQIVHRVFTSGKDHRIGISKCSRIRDITDGNTLKTFQRHKIRKIGNPRKPDHCNVDQGVFLFPVKSFRQAVLLVQIQMKIRDHAKHRSVDLFFQHPQSRFQDRDVAPELVDHRSDDPRFLVRLQ